MPCLLQLKKRQVFFWSLRTMTDWLQYSCLETDPKDKEVKRKRKSSLACFFTQNPAGENAGRSKPLNPTWNSETE